MSDTHMQSDYYPGSAVDKGCYDGKGNAGIFGDYNCRAPFIVEHSAMSEMAQNRPQECSKKDPMFILWTGDSGARRFGKFSQDIITWEMENITHELVTLQKSFKSHVPVYPVIGNHDSYPQHQFTATNSWVYETAAKLWSQFLPDDAVSTLKTHGYYAVTITHGLKLLVLNTVIYYHQNNKTSTSEKDPGGQIAWMRKQLAEAEKNGESVFVASHIPPGPTSDPFHTAFMKPFVEGFRGYNHIIRGSFWGHLHVDRFQLIGDTSSGSTDFHVGHLASTLGTKTGKNPTFRRYIFDTSDKFNIKDWTTIYMDLPAANKAGKIAWKTLYSAKSAFGIKDASPKTMRSLVDTFKKDSSMFDKFYKHQKGGAPIAGCDSTCKKDLICITLHSDPDEFKKCKA